MMAFGWGRRGTRECGGEKLAAAVDGVYSKLAALKRRDRNLSTVQVSVCF